MAFLSGQSAAICRGRGEIVEPVGELPKFSLLLLKPEFGVPTPWAYRQWRESRELPGVDYAPQSLGELVLENDLERPVFEKYVFLARMKSWLREQPEVAAALLSGSGSTMFAVLRDGETGVALAQRARAELDPVLWTCACATVDVLPLGDASAASLARAAFLPRWKARPLLRIRYGAERKRLQREQPLEVVDADLRPRFQIFSARQQLAFREESEVGDHRFALLHFRFFEPKNVHDSEMDAADLGRVVVQKRHDPVFKR